ALWHYFGAVDHPKMPVMTHLAQVRHEFVCELSGACDGIVFLPLLPLMDGLLHLFGDVRINVVLVQCFQSAIDHLGPHFRVDSHVRSGRRRTLCGKQSNGEQQKGASFHLGYSVSVLRLGCIEPEKGAILAWCLTGESFEITRKVTLIREARVRGDLS